MKKLQIELHSKYRSHSMRERDPFSHRMVIDLENPHSSRDGFGFLHDPWLHIKSSQNSFQNSSRTSPHNLSAESLSLVHKLCRDHIIAEADTSKHQQCPTHSSNASKFTVNKGGYQRRSASPQ